MKNCADSMQNSSTFSGIGLSEHKQFPLLIRNSFSPVDHHRGDEKNETQHDPRQYKCPFVGPKEGIGTKGRVPKQKKQSGNHSSNANQLSLSYGIMPSKSWFVFSDPQVGD
jgi:hypothetical protein